jgi:hypothetical protein
VAKSRSRNPVRAQETNATTISFQIDCGTADECAGYQAQLVAHITHDVCSTTDDGCDDGIYSKVSKRCSARTSQSRHVVVARLRQLERNPHAVSL